MPSSVSDRFLPQADLKIEPLVFDVSVLQAFLGQDTAAVASVLQTFLTSMGDNMVALRTALHQERFETVAWLAHRTKGAAFMSGALAMAQAAQGLEHASSTEDRQATQQIAAVLEVRWLGLQADPNLQSTLAGG